MVIIIKGLFSRNGDLSTEMTPIQNKKKARYTCNSENRVVNLTNLRKAGRKHTRSKWHFAQTKHRDYKKTNKQTK